MKQDVVVMGLGGSAVGASLGLFTESNLGIVLCLLVGAALGGVFGAWLSRKPTV